ncbi:MAG: UvrD-helicase domain-containing protein [candidate division Zixibacteria bacterium]|nr:UvrD-helicase domain-containing protein [candidate division Zixibacteria bacterium]
MKHILENLNPVQHEAVTTTEGPLLVVAGAGSGKTRVLTSRVAYILFQRLAAPHNILAVTFTNKAANEMKERIAAILGQSLVSLNVSTFHSFCARLLRKECQAIGFPSNFVIFDEEDAKALLKACLKELDLSPTQFSPMSLKHKISAAKNRMETASDFAQKASGYFETRTAEVYTRYERRLKDCGAFDFDDLIFRSVQLLAEHEDVRQKYRDRFKYILVDEYQDTNHSQYRLLKLLIGAHHNICVVGDEDQSIYGWRGADISNILNFEKDFPGAKVIKLEQNYRSTQIILEAASAVIANNVTRKDKTLWTEIKSGDPLKLFMTDNAPAEATAVVDEITRRLDTCPLKESVILYRTNAQSRAFEEILRRRNMPYQIVGGISFYQRKEIKDLLAYLKLLANPRDDVAFRRIVNYPKRGIGDTSVENLAVYARDHEKSLWDAAGDIEAIDTLGSRPKRLLDEFVKLLTPFREKKDNADIATLTQELVDALRLLEHLIDEDPNVGQGRVENVEEFIAAAREFVKAYSEPTLDNFLTEISLYTDIDKYNEIDDKLTLMTLHAAKGLEFDSVYLVGLEDGLFPLMRAIENPLELEEERRLFYVGATRAKKNLFLSMAAQRNRFGDLDSIPSRFISELPPALVEKVDLRSGNGNGRYGEYGGFRKKTPTVTVPDEPYYEYEEEEVMRAGRIVQHQTFGRGKIVKLEGSGESLALEIYFTGVGVKKIMAKYAKLKIVG